MTMLKVILCESRFLISGVIVAAFIFCKNLLIRGSDSLN